MAFAKRSFHTFCDSISRKMWGSDNLEAVTGDTAVSLDSQPVSGELRDKCLRFASAAGAGTGRTQYRIQYLPHGSAMLSGSIVETHPQIWLRVRMLVDVATVPSSGSIGLVQFGHGSQPVYRVVLNANGTLTLSSGASGVGTLSALGTGSTAVPYGQWFEIIVAVDQSAATATLKLKRQGDGGYSTEVSATSIASASEVATFAIGPAVNTLAGNGATSVYVDDFAISDRQESDVTDSYYTNGSGCRDIAATELALAFFYPSGLFNATHARVQIDTDEAFTAPMATTLTALSGVASSVLPISVTGLASGTRYYYRFQTSTSSDAGDINWTSETFTARTLCSAAPSVRRAFAAGSCAAQVGLAHPYEQNELLLSKATSDNSDWLGVFHLGDQGYETTGFGVRALDPDYLTPPETEADFEQQLREWFADHAYAELLQAGMFLAQPDDHAWINDGNGRMRPGGALADTLANNWGSKQATYSGAVTLSDLYTAGITVMDDWFSGHLIDRPTAGERYKSWVDGDVRFVLIDTRTERNTVTPIMVSPTQLAWIKSQADAFAASDNEKYLIFLSNGGWNQLNTKSSEGWERVASAQYYDLISYLDTNLPSSKRMVVMRGDDHAGYCHQQRQETASAVLATNAAIGPELIFSGTSITAFPSTDNPGTIQRYRIGDTGYPAASQLIRISLGLVTIDSEQQTINAKSWSIADNDGLDRDVVSLGSDNSHSFNSILRAGANTDIGPTELASYPLQEISGTTITDRSADKDGTLQGAASPSVVAGPTTWLPSALSLNGTSERVELPASIKVSGNSARTYTMWVNIQAFGTGSEIAFLDVGGPSSSGNIGKGLTLHAEDGAIAVGVFGHRLIGPKSTLSIDTWYFVALRIPDVAANSSEIELWLNSANVVLTTEAGSAATIATDATTAAYIGYYASSAVHSPVKIAGLTCHHEYCSDAKLLQIKAGPEPAKIGESTISGSAVTGATLTCTPATYALPAPFDGGTNGAIVVSYQWLRNGVPISGATSATYTTTIDDVGAVVRCRTRAANDGGYDPAEDSISNGILVGAAAPTWQLMDGETASTLSIPNVQAGDYGRRFRCVATNAAGSATSNTVEILAP